MNFIANSPLVAPEVELVPPAPPSGTRGIFPKADGWYEIDANGNTKRVGGVDEQGVGKQLEPTGAEAFNDYETNTSNIPYAHIEGRQNRALLRTFLITAYTSNTVTLTSAAGIEPGMKWCIFLNESGTQQRYSGTVVSVSGNIVTVLPDELPTTFTPSAKASYLGTFLVNGGSIGSYEVTDTAGDFSCHIEGRNNIAFLDSHAEGAQTKAMGHSSHAEGWGSQAMGTSSHAEGNSSHAEGYCSHAEGNSSHAEGRSSHAEGYSSHAEGNYSHAEGRSSHAEGDFSHAEGSGTHAEGNYSHAEGVQTEAVGVASHTEGYFTKSNIPSAHVEGRNNNGVAKVFLVKEYTENTVTLDSVDGIEVGMPWHIFLLENGEQKRYDGSIVSISGNTITVADDELPSRFTPSSNPSLLGTFIVAGGFLGSHQATSEESEFSSHIEGRENYGGLDAHAEGTNTNAFGWSSHAEGRKTTTFGEISHAEGYGGTAKGTGSHVEGASCRANGHYSHAEGYYTEVHSRFAHSEGWETVSEGDASHTEGYLTKTEADFAHAEGWETEAKGNASHAEGRLSQSLGKHSHAEGMQTVAAGNYAHSEGQYTEANGVRSHSEGYATIAQGDISHAEGHQTKAVGVHSHAEGNNSQALGNDSHAEGTGTITSCTGQHAEGKFNIEDAEGQYAHIVGNGTSDTARSNAYTLDWDGNGRYTGKVYAENDKELATKEYINTNFEFSDYTSSEETEYTTIPSISNRIDVDGNDLQHDCTFNVDYMMDIPLYAANGELIDYIYVNNAKNISIDFNQIYEVYGKRVAYYTIAGLPVSFTVTVKRTMRISGLKAIFINSSTPGSNKRFKITVDDSGEIHTEEIV